MDKKYSLLVIDEQPSFYDDLFINGWVKKKVNCEDDTRTIETGNALHVLKVRDYDAVLIQFEWLSTHLRTVLSELHRISKPFVVISTLTESENRQREPVTVWASRIGASGVIDLSTSDKVGELYAIIQHFDLLQPAFPQLGNSGGLDDFKLVVNFLLRQPTICFRHYPFFGKTCEDGIFGDGVLESLSEYSAKELCDALRYAICMAVLDAQKNRQRENMIEKRHMWKRLSVQGIKKLDDDDRVFLFSVNQALSAKAIGVVAKEYNMAEEQLREYLRILKRRNEKLFSKSTLRYIFEHAKLNLVFVYHLSSKNQAAKVIKHFEILHRAYELLFHDCIQGIIPGKDREEEINRIVDLADVAIVMLCPNLFTQDEQGDSDYWINALFQKYGREGFHLVPLHLVPVAWTIDERFVNLQILPRHQTAVFARLERADIELADVVEDVKKTIIDEIWLKSSHATHQTHS